MKRQQAAEKFIYSESKPKMLTVFIDYRGVVYSQFLQEGQTVNKQYYLVFERECPTEKKTDLWKSKSWIWKTERMSSIKHRIVQTYTRTYFIPQTQITMIFWEAVK